MKGNADVQLTPQARLCDPTIQSWQLFQDRLRRLKSSSSREALILVEQHTQSTITAPTPELCVGAPVLLHRVVHSLVDDLLKLVEGAVGGISVVLPHNR